MSESKHTPGPWELQGGYRDIMTKDARVCTVRHGYVTRETYHANARLIAAAPDLIAALRYVLELHDANEPIEPKDAELLRAAIAKVEGRV